MTRSEITQTPRFLIKGCLSLESTAMFVNCALAAMESTLERRHQFKFDKVLTFMASAAAAISVESLAITLFLRPRQHPSLKSNQLSKCPFTHGHFQEITESKAIFLPGAKIDSCFKDRQLFICFHQSVAGLIKFES